MVLYSPLPTPEPIKEPIVPCCHCPQCDSRALVLYQNHDTYVPQVPILLPYSSSSYPSYSLDAAMDLDSGGPLS
eukprot:NODE_6262_length_520_cov_128.276008_g5494_i0.p5 GENE.NODE_6262_length_520_cov_128.276008_g5494_i0~~NODE_6262_length_520_cov_128.276008_g5494_i0.p5  ORF type:complete len:74 (-),score=14.17 NODE_6262_length_520_cov_128.276008_g5494_i0:117-338(-)